LNYLKSSILVITAYSLLFEERRAVGFGGIGGGNFAEVKRFDGGGGTGGDEVCGELVDKGGDEGGDEGGDVFVLNALRESGRLISP